LKVKISSGVFVLFAVKRYLFEVRQAARAVKTPGEYRLRAHFVVSTAKNPGKCFYSARNLPHLKNMLLKIIGFSTYAPENVVR